jgi:hypothetical protein
MDTETSASIPPELRAVLDLEFTIQGRNTAVAQQQLADTLAGLPGVASVSFSEDKIAIEYDPQDVCQKRLRELVVNAGFAIAGCDAAPPQPPVEQ